MLLHIKAIMLFKNNGYIYQLYNVHVIADIYIYIYIVFVCEDYNGHISLMNPGAMAD